MGFNQFGRHHGTCKLSWIVCSYSFLKWYYTALKTKAYLSIIYSFIFLQFHHCNHYYQSLLLPMVQKGLDNMGLSSIGYYTSKMRPEGGLTWLFCKRGINCSTSTILLFILKVQNKSILLKVALIF